MINTQDNTQTLTLEDDVLSKELMYTYGITKAKEVGLTFRSSSPENLAQVLKNVEILRVLPVRVRDADGT